MYRTRLPAVFAAVLFAVGACAPRATATPETPVQGAEFTVEVVNTMPHAMNVSYELGTELTALGSVDANQTRRFTIPNRGGDSIRLVASDQGQTHKVNGTVNLDSGEVKRWEIR